ncbi:sensor domain-containing diguanylate cyclase [Oceanospirillum sanctuarii]|uniref:sensor domain-containing diguanylate cyclase n=1 Tax=Oceanospirillum sanctuarii TaxID=1434821 RepID=UPI000A3B35BD|nr:diguanylate cyclase [Oceanospirillum sanctuarii]
MKAYSNRLSYITLIAGFIISALIAWNIGVLRHDAIRVQLKGEMKELSYQVSRELFVNFEALYVMQGLFTGSSSVSSEEFRRVADGTLSRHPELHYLQWAPLVNERDRATFELSQKAEDPRFAIQEVSDKGRWMPAAVRGRYFPVVYQADKGMTKVRTGFDLSSNPALLSAINKASDSSELAATEPMELKAEGLTGKRVLAVLPVYESLASGQSGELKGVVAGQFTLNRLVQEALMGGRSSGLHIALLDMATLQEKGSDQALLFVRQPVTPPVMDMQQRYMINDVGGRNWQLVVAPSEGYMNERKSELAYVVMMAGLMITGLVAAYLRMLSKRSFEIETVADERNHALQEANKKLAHLSQTDGLTQISNRRFFDESFIQEWKRTKREKQPISLVLFDLDFFKQYNDQYGHLQGDECLRSIAELVASVINRPGDLFARFGGEEFILLLPNTPEAGALKIANQCRELVESLSIPHHKSTISDVVTISVGVCSLIPESGVTEHDMLDLTDQALYCAKDRGRNQVVSANHESFEPRKDLKRKL